MNKQEHKSNIAETKIKENLGLQKPYHDLIREDSFVLSVNKFSFAFQRTKHHIWVKFSHPIISYTILRQSFPGSEGKKVRKKLKKRTAGLEIFLLKNPNCNFSVSNI